MNRRAASSLAVALLLLAGCSQREVEGNTTIYRFADFVSYGVLILCMLAIPGGWLLRRWSAQVGWVLLACGVLFLPTIVPGLFIDRVVLDDDHFHLHTGFWFAPTEHTVRFEEVQTMMWITREDARGRQSHDLHCRLHSGQVAIVPLGDLMREAVNDILERARKRGIHVAGVPRG